MVARKNALRLALLAGAALAVPGAAQAQSSGAGPVAHASGSDAPGLNPAVVGNAITRTDAALNSAADFVDAALSFYGHGFKLHVGAPDDSKFDVAHDVLFASGAAMVMPKKVFTAAGGFDERYFMFFEDVDLGWRLWMLGWRVRYVPGSLVYHRHHASMSRYASWRETLLRAFPAADGRPRRASSGIRSG